MDSFSAIIIDDEPKLRDVLQNKLEKFCPEIKILAQAEDAISGYHLIKTQQPQIVFLDISMPVMSGFEMLDRFNNITFEIIFVTGYDAYALDALKLSAVDYLLKPIKTSDLQSAVQKAITRIKEQRIVKNFDVLKQNLHGANDQSKRIAIPGTDAYEFVTIREIIRCEGWQKYTRIHLVNKKTLLSSYNIGVFKELLLSYHFYSTHKSHLINREHISKYHKEGSLIMSDGSNVPIARRRKEAFVEDVLKNIS